MDQTLIDKFKPEVRNLSEALIIQEALAALPDNTIDCKIEELWSAYVTLDSQNIVRLGNHSMEKPLPVVIPTGATDCRVNGAICTFSYRQMKYRIN